MNFQIEQQLFTELNEDCFFDINVATLTRFANTIIAKNNSSSRVLTKPVCVALIKKILVENKDKFTTIKKAINYNGFASTLFDTISMFKSCNVTVDKVDTMTRNSNLNYKLSDIKLVYKYYEDFLKNPWNYNFFLDFIEDDPEHDIIVSNLSIKEVGDRQTASTVESINCIFEPTPKNTIIINWDDPQEEINEQKQWAQINGYNILYFPNELFENLGIGGTKNSAFEYIKSMLHEWVSYNEAITIQCLPIYHLEPNTRIKVEDSDSNIFGEYVISSISIPLDIKGTMSITATRALEKF